MNSFIIKTAKSQCSCKNKCACVEDGTSIKKKRFSICNNLKITRDIPLKHDIRKYCFDTKNFVYNTEIVSDTLHYNQNAFILVFRPQLGKYF